MSKKSVPAMLFLQQADDKWIRMSGRVGLTLGKRVENDKEGLSLNVETAEQGFVVPKRARRLWLGSTSTVKCFQKGSLEFRFTLPTNPQGFMGCATAFDSAEDITLFKESLLFFGGRINKYFIFTYDYFFVALQVSNSLGQKARSGFARHHKRCHQTIHPHVHC
jgi:hypothetical protein